jgi:hypothetical protein
MLCLWHVVDLQMIVKWRKYLLMNMHESYSVHCAVTVKLISNSPCMYENNQIHLY